MAVLGLAACGDGGGGDSADAPAASGAAAIAEDAPVAAVDETPPEPSAEAPAPDPAEETPPPDPAAEAPAAAEPATEPLAEAPAADPAAELPPAENPASAEPEPVPPAPADAAPAEETATLLLTDDGIALDPEMAALIEAGDPDRGQSYIQRCTGCHSFREEGPGVRGPFVGPPLYGVFERAIAAAPDFEYTPAFLDLAGTQLVWDEAHLNAFLTDPEGTVPGTGMAIRGTADPEDRANVIAFLKTLVFEDGPFAGAADPALMQRIAVADIGDGELLAARCSTCHQYTADGGTLVGPSLFGIVGAAVGAIEGFDYSQAMLTLGANGAVWTYERLDEFLANPAVAVPGTRMGFGGVADEDNRAAIIAFLRSISPQAPPLAGTENLGIGVFRDDLNRLVFTTTQVSFGLQYFSLLGCDTCHGVNLQGLAAGSLERLAPALVGTAFADKWFGGTMFELYNYTYQHAGAVTQIEDGHIPLVLAYILSHNGFEGGGDAELPRDGETLRAMGFWQ